MIYNYLKIAIRNIISVKTYAAINLIGLAIGFTCIILIASFVYGELSYDKFHSEKVRVFRVVNNHTSDAGELTKAAYTYAPLAGVINDNLAGLKDVLRLHEKQGLLWIDGGEKFLEKNFIYADSSFFRFFDFKITKGDVENPLSSPFSAVISEKLALKHFGSADPIGKTLNNQDDNGTNQLVVTAVMEDFPANSHLSADLICSMATLQKTQPWNFYWFYPPMYTYLQFENTPQVESTEKQITEFVQANVPDGFGTVDYQLQRLDNIHLHSQREGEFRATGNYTIVVLFIIVAFFILVIAAVNFMNLATARSVKKAKEVGVRKVMGAYRGQLLMQFLTESVLTSFFAFLVSIGLILVLTPSFEAVIHKSLSFDFLMTWQSAAIIVVALLIIGGLAGIYPSVFLSSFNPLTVLRQNSPQRSPGAVRRVLVIFQFFITSMLIIGTLVIYQQLNFMQSKNLGFDKAQLIVIPLEETKDQQNFELLKQMLKSHSAVEEITMTSGVPGTEGFYGFNYNVGTNPESVSAATLGTDEDFVETYNINIIRGRNFSEEISTDESESFLVNQAAIDFFGWDDGLGEDLTLTYYIDGPVVKKGQVVGIMEDFHFESLYHSIDPLVAHILPPSYYSQYLTVKLNTPDILEAIDFFEGQWSSFNSDRPFEYYLLDENLSKTYSSEIQLSQTFTWFAFLAIMVSCLGLIGLVAFSTEQRTKEIGIRKVMGASVTRILGLITKEYLVLIIVANLVAWPLGWYFLEQWLSDFAYRVSVEWTIFLYTCLSVIAIAMLAVGWLTLKAARNNPVKSLKYE